MLSSKTFAQLTSPCRAAIVDLDGTMVDTLGDFVVALGLALAHHQLPPVDRATVERLVGKGAEHLVRSALAHLSADDALAPAVLQTYQDHYRAINGQHAQVYDSVHEGLAQLRALGWPLACVTNKPLAFARDLLTQKHLAQHFGCVFGGDSFAKRKPDPMPLLEACRALQSTPAQTLVIGDSSNDATAARAAGCPVVLMSYGYNHGQDVRALLAAGLVDGVLDRLDGL